MLSTAHYKIPAAVSQQLVIDARTTELRLALSPDGITSGRYRDCVAIRVNDEVEVLLAATWDLPPWEMDVDIQLKGLLLAIASSDDCCADSPHYAMIIIEQHDDHWERVAMAFITKNYLKSGTEDAEPMCDFTTAYSPLFCQISTGALYTRDQRSFNNRTTITLDLSSLEITQKKPSCTHCTELETIFLE